MRPDAVELCVPPTIPDWVIASLASADPDDSDALLWWYQLGAPLEYPVASRAWLESQISRLPAGWAGILRSDSTSRYAQLARLGDMLIVEVAARGLDPRQVVSSVAAGRSERHEFADLIRADGRDVVVRTGAGWTHRGALAAALARAYVVSGVLPPGYTSLPLI